MNKYKKYCPNVFVAECTEKHEKGETIIVETKYGKENEHIIHNLIGYAGTKENQTFCYSITRADGFNNQERAKNRAERLKSWAYSAEAKSDSYYNKSNKDKDFLSLGEPIKAGHHSERRHKKMFEDAHKNMGKSIDFQHKADDHLHKAKHWERLADKIDLSMPESMDFYPEQLKEAKEYHSFLKDNPEARPHSMALTYAKNTVNELERKVKLSIKLWGDNPEPEEEKKPEPPKNRFDDFDGLFFAFNNSQFSEGMKKIGLNPDDTDKILSIGAGGYIAKNRKEEFHQIMKGLK